MDARIGRRIETDYRESEEKRSKEKRKAERKLSCRVAMEADVTWAFSKNQINSPAVSNVERRKAQWFKKSASAPPVSARSLPLVLGVP